MKLTPTTLNDVFVLEPVVWPDERGFLYEAFNQRQFANALGREVSFVQENQSLSKKNVLRGLHYQIEEPQAKLVRVLRGDIFDVAVDLRSRSPTFGKWVGVVLSAENRKQMWIPEGFAHGFLVLSDEAEVLYKTSRYYNPAGERVVIWDDRELGISWPLMGSPRLSQKDRVAPSLAEADLPLDIV